MSFFAPSEVQGGRPKGTEPACGLCKRLHHCRSPKMAPYGQGQRRLAIVLPTPAGGDDAQGRPYTSPQDLYLAQALQRLGIDVARDCWTLHAIACHSPTKPSSPAEVDHCQPLLIKRLQQLQPVAALLVGTEAVRGVIGHTWKEAPGSVDKWAGFAPPCQTLNAHLHPVWSSTYVAEQSAGRRRHPVVPMMWNWHLEAFAKQTQRPWETVPQWDKDVQLMFDEEQAVQALHWVAAQGEGAAAFDFETNSLKPEWARSAIASASVAWGRAGVECCFAYLWTPRTKEATAHFLTSPVPKIASNLKFEHRWATRQVGVRIRNWWLDTMLAAHILDPREAITGLKFQAYALLGHPAYDHVKPWLASTDEEGFNKVFTGIDKRSLLLYNGLDSLLEWYVARIQARLLGWPMPKGMS